MTKYKWCRRCQTTKFLNEFAKNKLNKDGLQTYCKACQKSYRNPETAKVYAKQYRADNKERLLKAKRVAGKIYYQKNRDKILERQRKNYTPESSTKKNLMRRAFLSQVQVFQVSRAEVRSMQKQRCFYCGEAGGTIDHVIPLSRGGSHAIGNLVPACRTCNLSKGKKLIVEWKKVRGW